MARRKKNKKKRKKEKKVLDKANMHPQSIPGYTCHQRIVVDTSTDDEWEVKLDVVEKCGKVSNNGEVTVWIDPLAKLKIDALMEEYTSREWLGYLLGDKENRIVNDIYIPEQVATSARVDEIECDEYNELPVIGVIHSHHSMGTGFSGTDNTYINQNHDISLVVAKNGIDGQVRVKVPCGSMMISKPKIRLKLNVEGFDKEKFIETVKENIKSTKIVTYKYQAQTIPVGRQPQGFWQNGQFVEYTPQNRGSFWMCKHCNTQNFSSVSVDKRECWWCNKKQIGSSITINDNGGKWRCGKCRGINLASQAIECLYCKTPRTGLEGRKLTLAEKNQLKIEREWKKSTEEKKSRPSLYEYSKKFGNYICGRCGGNWHNVNLEKFTSCPNCDRIV